MTEKLDCLALSIQKEEKERTGREMSDQEAKEASDNLVGFFDLLLKIDRRNKRAERQNSKNNHRTT